MQPTPLTDKFLADLQVKMNDLKLKQTELSAILGTSKVTVNRYFRGVRRPSSEFVLKIQEWIKTQR